MPFSNVPTTEVNVLVSEIDFFTWPCISGEKYPPTLGTGWAYGIIDGFTCVQETGAASNSTVTWPNIPLVKPTSTTFSGYTASLKFRSSGSTGGGSGQYYTMTLPGNLALTLSISSNNTTCFYNSGGALPALINQPVANFNDGVFHTFTMTVTGTLASATAIFTIDDVTIHTFSSFALSGTSGQFILNRNTAGTLIQYVSTPYMLYS